MNDANNLPEYVFNSQRRELRPWSEFLNLFRFSDLLFQLTRRDLISRYKRSTLGVVWTMINPLGTMVILTYVFAGLFHKVGGYPVYVLSGIIAWNFFSQTTSTALHQMIWGASLMRKIYIPRSTFVVSTVLTGIVNILLAMIPMMIIMGLVGSTFGPALLFLPVAIVCIGLFSLGMGLLLSTLAVYFTDIADMYQMVLLAWMYLTPVFYPKEILLDSNRGWLMKVNPMYYLIEMFRAPIYQGSLPHWSDICIGAGISLIVAVAGWIFFTHKSDEFIYRI